MQPSLSLHNIRNRDIPKKTQCGLCLIPKDSTGRKWAYHPNGGKKHLIHIECWKQLLEKGFNCPSCRVKVDGGDVLPNVRYLPPGRVSVFYRIMERVLPHNERFPTIVQQYWEICLFSSYVSAVVITITSGFIFLNAAEPQLKILTSDQEALTWHILLCSSLLAGIGSQSILCIFYHATDSVIRDRFHYVT